jgi:hypothetical protein
MVDADGGFFGIVSDEGTHYVPGKLDPLFQVEGLRVSYRVLVRHDRVDPHNWGTPVDLLEIVQVGRVIEQRIEGDGVIHYEDIEGGTYGIISDTGGRYLPLNLDDSFRTAGQRVNFSAYPATVSTISMWGTPVRLVTIIETDVAGPSLIDQKGYIRKMGSSTEAVMYCIVGDDGTIYIPTELDGVFRHDGLYVRFIAEEVRRNAMISRTIKGTVVHLLNIELNSR